MPNRIILAAVMLALSIGAGAAQDTSNKDNSKKDAPKKERCPTLDRQEIEGLLGNAPSCQRAMALFELCQFGAGGDVGLGEIVTHKCEGDFLSKLNRTQKRAYQREQLRCQRKYSNQSGTMYRSFEAFCGAGVARNYSARFLKTVPAGRI
jgi:hypothetical protein